VSPSAAGTTSGTGGTPGSANPQATTAGSGRQWSIRSLSAVLDGSNFVVSGTVENGARALNVYAEITVYDERGRILTSGDSPVHPSPVPSGSTAAFEVRLPIKDLVRRYMVVVRQTGMITGSLAERVMEVRDRQQFAPVVAGNLQVQVRFNPSDLTVVVEVRNPTTAVLSNVNLAVEYATQCYLPLPRPGRFITQPRSGTVSVTQIDAGGSGQATIAIPRDQEGCQGYTGLGARGRVLDLKIAE
jgi:hypothetical protein